MRRLTTGLLGAVSVVALLLSSPGTATAATGKIQLKSADGTTKTLTNPKSGSCVEIDMKSVAILNSTDNLITVFSTPACYSPLGPAPTLAAGDFDSYYEVASVLIN